MDVNRRADMQMQERITVRIESYPTWRGESYFGRRHLQEEAWQTKGKLTCVADDNRKSMETQPPYRQTCGRLRTSRGGW